MGLFESIGIMLRSFVSIFVHSAEAADEVVYAIKDVGSVARISAKELKRETKRNSEHNGIIADMKFAKKEEKLKTKLGKSGTIYQTQAEKKAAKKLAKEQKFEEAVKAAAAEAAKNTATAK